MKKTLFILFMSALLLLSGCGKKNVPEDAEASPPVAETADNKDSAILDKIISKSGSPEKSKTDEVDADVHSDAAEDNSVKSSATPTPAPTATAKPAATPTPAPTATAKPAATPTPAPTATAKPQSEKTICDHNYTSAVTTAASCTKTGVKTYTCALCGDSYSETIPMKDHTIVKDSSVKATCQHTGLTEGSHCSTCGKVLVEQKETAKTDHTKTVSKTVAATCTVAGYTEYKCSVCGENMGRETISATGHRFANGFCTKCGELDPDLMPYSTERRFVLPEED